MHHIRFHHFVLVFMSVHMASSGLNIVLKIPKSKKINVRFVYIVIP